MLHASSSTVHSFLVNVPYGAGRMFGSLEKEEEPCRNFQAVPVRVPVV